MIEYFSYDNEDINKEDKSPIEQQILKAYERLLSIYSTLINANLVLFTALILLNMLFFYQYVAFYSSFAGLLFKIITIVFLICIIQLKRTAIALKNYLAINKVELYTQFLKQKSICNLLIALFLLLLSILFLNLNNPF